MTCVRPNGNSAIHTQTQMQMETEGYRMHPFWGSVSRGLGIQGGMVSNVGYPGHTLPPPPKPQ